MRRLVLSLAVLFAAGAVLAQGLPRTASPAGAKV